jgi:transposase
MARKTETVNLSEAEVRSLTTIVSRGTSSARRQTRARILDLLDRGEAPADIAALLGISPGTVYNIKRRYLVEGLEAALSDRPRSGRPVRISGAARAKITALACSEAPPGHARWTLRLLADKAVELGFVEAISHNAVKEVLKKTTSSRT